MGDYKIILGVTATIVGFIGYIPYIRDTLRGKTKPHIFSWAVWGTLETIGFFAQIVTGAGAGAWVTGTSALITFFIMFLALRNSDKQIQFLDWIALTGALLGILLWRLTDNPLLAVICVMLADALGFVPTFRKAYVKPAEETLTEYFLSAVKWSIALFALESFQLTTWLYPASLVLTNGLFVLMVLSRRNKRQYDSRRS